MTTSTVNNKNHPQIFFLTQLYQTAFPIHERRKNEQLIELIGHPDMHLELIEDEHEPIGFVIWWLIEGLHYIEHFAINADKRRKQYGSRIIKLLLEKSENKLILEVEPPIDADAQRRIVFYERLGLRVIPFDYIQPPYRKEDEGHPMLLMSSAVISEVSVFYKITEAIKEKVYKQFY